MFQTTNQLCSFFFAGPRSLEGIYHAKSALKRSACTSSKALPGYVYILPKNIESQRSSLLEGFLYFLTFLNFWGVPYSYIRSYKQVDHDMDG